MIIVYLSEIQFWCGNGIDNIGQKKAHSWLTGQASIDCTIRLAQCFQCHNLQSAVDLSEDSCSIRWILCDVEVLFQLGRKLWCLWAAAVVLLS